MGRTAPRAHPRARCGPMMSRRTFLAGAVTLLAAPLAAHAQRPAKKQPRVTLVFSTTPVAEMLGPDPIAPDARAFVHALRDSGWVDGQTVVIERRSAAAQWDQVPA